MRARGGTASLVLGVWASGVFVAFWLGAAAGLASGGLLFDQAWTLIGDLETAGAVVVWILFLPICIGLWLTQSSLSVPVAVLVLALLAAWTALAWGALARELAARRRPG